MTSLRSEDWSVRPSFVANGPTSPVTLLMDDTGVTQLAGIPPVAWQTPWSELRELALVSSSYQLVLFATVDGVRYCWRHRDARDLEALSALVVQHGGVVTRRRRRAVVYLVVGVVALASFAGGLGAWLSHGGVGARELADARAINLTMKDLPSGWYVTTNTPLAYVVPPSNQVFTATTTTAPAKNSIFNVAAQVFQSCLGVTSQRDRVYGAAGQQPDYQVSSPIFNTNALGGVEVASTSQYYRTTTMVAKDTAEMSMKNFGLCFVDSSSALIRAGMGQKSPATPGAYNWAPRTFTRGWSRGGVVALTLPGLGTRLQLVMVVVTHGHYEATLSALVSSFQESKSLLATLVNAMLSRMTNASSTPA